ncbi:phosphatase PAP2 family protein [Shewanella sp. AS1]|uniref:phosphatase PAP2 family protein n=1 Tax=Shewanella sp. AS1 TaxID=2907626 RepID=UPI001F3F8972|nr:phosphatase PAP2 family protein [Shewanella sp. AS1]MCE9679938.1 phosphatase PAP2 family protein [Shewanella sp. AS1]
MFTALIKLDRQVFALINHFGHQKQLHIQARWISASGDGPLYLLLILALCYFDARGFQLFNTALVGFLLELPLYLLLKNSIRRTRPCDRISLADGLQLRLDFQPSDKFSLPSGHSAAACVMATSIAAIYPQMMLFVYGWALLIGLSRIVLGVHYPLDIAAGFLLGGGSGYLAIHWLASVY